MRVRGKVQGLQKLEQTTAKDTKTRLDLWLISTRPIKCEGEKAGEMGLKRRPNLEAIWGQDSMLHVCTPSEHMLCVEGECKAVPIYVP